MKKKVIIDTDPGVDDAIAIMLAIKSNVFDIKAITTVCGNSTIENTTRNAAYILRLLKSENIPLYSGASSPLKRPLKQAVVHGKKGLDGISIRRNTTLTNNAANKIISYIQKYPNEITIISLGPLTNIATAIQKNPRIMKNTKEIIIMGGAIKAPGNTNCVAEFNIFVDPEAADIVCKSSIKKTFVPLDICNKITINTTDLKKLTNKKVFSTLSKIITPYIKKLSKENGSYEAILYDPLAVYYAINPNAAKTYLCTIAIETEGRLTRGMTVTDLRKKRIKTANTTVVDYVNKISFKNNFINVLNS